MIDAALAVNAAPTIEAALDLLAERARILLSADGASVVVWDPERRAEAALATAGAFGSSHADGMASSVSVPLSTGGSDAVALEAGWRTPCTRAHLDAAVETLTDLTGLTRIAVSPHGGRRGRPAAGCLEGYVEDLLDALPAAACVTDPNTGALVKVNRTLTELTGYSPAELVGLTPPHPWLAAAENPGPDGKTPMLLRHKGGRPTPVEIRRLPVRSSDGEVRAWVSLITDRGERRLPERPPIQSGKLASAGESVDGVAHEINNLLFAILSLTELLLEDAEPNSQGRERLELIRSTGGEIRDVVRSLTAKAAA